MSKSWHIFYLIAIILLLSFFLFTNKKTNHDDANSVKSTDTVFITKLDTVTEYKPKYIKTKPLKDTVYIPTNKDGFATLFFTQKHYKKDSVYDIWVSGYEAKIDSLRFYPKTKYVTINNTITKKDNSINLYTYVGLSYFNGLYTPNIGLLLKGRKRFIYGAEIGIDGYKNVYYGLKIGYRIK